MFSLYFKLRFEDTSARNNKEKWFFLWFFAHLFVSLPTFTTNQRCIGCQSSMKSEAINRNNRPALSADGVTPRSGHQGTVL